MIIVTNAMVEAAAKRAPSLPAETVRAMLESALASDVLPVPPLPWAIEVSMNGRGRNVTHGYSIIGADGERVATWFADTPDECRRIDARARFFIRAAEFMLRT